MGTKDKKTRLLFLPALTIIAVIALLINANVMEVYAADNTEQVEGIVYEFGEKSSYDIESADNSSSSAKAETYGTFSLTGDISTITKKNGVPAYGVSDGTLKLSYVYDDVLLNAEADERHLEKDSSKKVNGISLDDDIQYGAIILQTSKDGKIWFDVPEQSRTNVFSDEPTQNGSFYETTDVQMVNGCYYRLIVAYMTGIRTETARVFPPRLEKVERTKVAEVYKFYAYNESAMSVEVPNEENRLNLGSKVRASNSGYSGESQMDNSDPHFGWDIGQFFVGGFTDYELDKNGNPVFLKNSGDLLSLWFELQQDIDQCYGNSAIHVVEDTEGSDDYFEVPGGVNETTDFGRGVLIIRRTDSENVKGEPQIYTNYLEASASVDAVTKVDLLEEGDYEVALDYAVKFDKTIILGKSILPETAKYKVFFKFSVRNGNSMVFLFDQATGSELSSGSITENGFRLDFANSQYLKVKVKREVLKDGYDGLTEDTRFNSSASDGDVFTSEGVYTVTITNQYNGAVTEKKVYVGTDEILKAHMTTGKSIPEIKELVAVGALIEDDGTIVMPEPETEAAITVATTDSDKDNSINEPAETEPAEDSTEDADFGNNTEVVSQAESQTEVESESGLPIPIIAGVVVMVILVVGIAIGVGKRKKGKAENDGSEDE